MLPNRRKSTVAWNKLRAHMSSSTDNLICQLKAIVFIDSIRQIMTLTDQFPFNVRNVELPSDRITILGPQLVTPEIT